MFLHLLNTEEKENFLELCFHAANCNKNFALEQQAFIDAYRKEMELPEDHYPIHNKDFLSIMDFFKPKDLKIKQVVFLEIVGLLLSDNEYDEDEKRMVDLIQDSLSIPTDFKIEVIGLVQEMQHLYTKASKLIGC